MKKFEIETTMNGGAVVTQRHTIGTDGCETSYGDKWSFDSCAKAGEWVDEQLQQSIQSTVLNPGEEINIQDITLSANLENVGKVYVGAPYEN